MKLYGEASLAILAKTLFAIYTPTGAVFFLLFRFSLLFNQMTLHNIGMFRASHSLRGRYIHTMPCMLRAKFSEFLAGSESLRGKFAGSWADS